MRKVDESGSNSESEPLFLNDSSSEQREHFYIGESDVNALSISQAFDQRVEELSKELDQHLDYFSIDAIDKDSKVASSLKWASQNSPGTVVGHSSPVTPQEYHRVVECGIINSSRDALIALAHTEYSDSDGTDSGGEDSCAATISTLSGQNAVSYTHLTLPTKA